MSLIFFHFFKYFVPPPPSGASLSLIPPLGFVASLVNMNSLFTIAVFVGLSLTILGQCNLENRSFCDTDVDVPKKVIVLEVVLFSFFLFSSLVAQGLKLTLNLLHSKEVDKAFQAHINLKALRLAWEDFLCMFPRVVCIV
ncbi:hypothetical protein GLYMA_07G239800v4 [Glycine max]|uniref:Uncharacterized protein n=1 Tax=Glycine max TaxID=3847 RepID=K7L3J9_SOYBN|nr:hypothetical protein GLYMA_07G239800v4 [Glycine max]KAG4401295.1 hypothetical protein GLYMA_07G239800v4 [Glycine max]KAG4401296.1 hypothetical protein GLYMA_07G239800v4 [Glycine max]KRH50729.1 hypothetical protein GLYMA_07G239800v4 [Glycine max]